MTATDTIRAMLDERGVAYGVSTTGHSIYIDPYTTVYANMSDTTLDVSLRQVTPEQAIEATLADHRYDDKVFETLNATSDGLIYENAKLRELVRDFYPFASGRAAKPWLEVRLERMRELGVEV